jgi:phage tail sheath protein FI
MSVTYTYPGIYIQELPGPTETITPAPTSVTVFVGYTHPFKTQSFGKAVEIFSFTDYQREFGGLYANAWLDANVAYAVYQFFLNGGSDAFVVGLQSAIFSGWTPPVPAATPALLGTPPSGGASGALSVADPANTGTGLTFWGLEPIDPAHPMNVVVSNIAASASGGAYDLADYVVSYGSVVETFRRVSLQQFLPTPPTAPPGAPQNPNPNFIETRINGTSQLVWVSPISAAYPKGFPASLLPPAPPQVVSIAYPPSQAPPPAGFSQADFTDQTKGPFVEDGSLDKVPIFNLMVIPGVTDAGVWAQAIAFCERKRAFLILDPPPNYSSDGMTSNLPGIADIVTSGVLPQSINAALYFPYLTSSDALSGNPIRLPPSGTVAGVFATTDKNRGVWKAPAGLETVVNSVTGVVPEGILTDNRQGVLNPLGLDCLRTFSGIGTTVFGARTTTTANTSQQQWRYVPVRRMALFLEQTLYANLGWVIFEPNDTPLWTAITTTINAFMLTLFHQQAFQGDTPTEAFKVICDDTTTTQTDINNGIVNILVAFAPLKPAEFVVIKIAQLAGQTQS